MKKHMMYIIPALALGAAACTSTGETERNALGGAAIGAAAGAIIGNNTGDGDAATGAAVGAAVGGAAGAARGCTNAEDCDMPGVDDQADERDYDNDGVADVSDRYPTDPSCW